MARVKEPGPRTLRIVLSSREQPWVGPKVPQLNALDDEGFVIRVLRDDAGRANGLQFASKSSIGQFWALSYFFHNVVGARWVLPGAVGEVVPPGPWHVPARYEVIHPGPQYQQRSLLTERLYLFKKEKAYGRIQSMIHPLIPYGIKGATWYQGEANTTRAYQYRSLLKTMIRAYNRRAARNLAISSNRSVCTAKKNDSCGAIASTARPRAMAAST